MKRVVALVDGAVQGVGFRWWGQRQAERLGLTGTVRNLPDGRVEFHLQGPDQDVDAMVAALQGCGDATPPGWVDACTVRPEGVEPGERSFRVVF